MDEIKKIIVELIKPFDVKEDLDLLSPPKPEMGDYTFACFDLAKDRGEEPAKTARFLADQIQVNNIINKIEAKGPYLNFFIKPEIASKILMKSILAESQKKIFNSVGNNKKILLEYPSNNTHKEVHVGHLRNICIGNSLRNIFLANGYKVIPINYINDFGAHVAKCLWGLVKFHAKDNPPVNKQKWLGDIYAKASAYLENNPEYKSEVQEIQKQLEAKDKKIMKLYNSTREWSLLNFKKIYKQLGVYHKKTFFEKDIKKLGQKMVDDLIKKGIAKTGEGGAIIADLSKFDLNIALLRKSDGSGLYMTSDLGLALIKNKKFPRTAGSVHITGSEQEFYFKQLFKILELAGFKFKMTHISFGLVSLVDGKISSRKGRAPLFEDVWQSVFEKAIEETTKRHNNWSAKKINKIASTIAMAAIKFDFLKHESAKTMIFDPSAAMSFDGFTGPYILYTIARINSLQKNKTIKGKVDYSLLITDEEKQLIFALANFNKMIAKSLRTLNPSVIAKYAFDTAKFFNDFYNKRSVLKAQTKELILARLHLATTTKNILQSCLRLLSIKSVDAM